MDTPDRHPDAGSSTGRTLLAASGLKKSFGGFCVVDDMAITVATGEMVGLIGPNGAGKTTLFNLLAGTLRPDAGEIRLGEMSLTRQPAERRMASGLGRTFQIPRPFANMSALENVLAGVQGQSGERVLPNFLWPNRVARETRDAVARARDLLAFVSLDHLQDEPARVLLGGQRKLLELARVMAAEPSVILLDEPGAGVNPALLDLICDRIVEINRSGVTVLLIEHNMEMVARLCTRVVVMASGRQLAEGTPAEVTANREVLEAYLGDTLH